MGYKYDSIVFEDVNAGVELPAIVMPLTVRRCVMAASAARDFQSMHHDTEYARNVSKTRNMFLANWFYTAMSSRLLTDWAGPEATMSKLELEFRQSACAGDELKVSGKVSATRVEEGKHIVEVDIEFSTHLGVTTTATAEAILPSRNC